MQDAASQAVPAVSLQACFSLDVGISKCELIRVPMSVLVHDEMTLLRVLDGYLLHAVPDRMVFRTFGEHHLFKQSDTLNLHV